MKDATKQLFNIEIAPVNFCSPEVMEQLQEVARETND